MKVAGDMLRSVVRKTCKGGRGGRRGEELLLAVNELVHYMTECGGRVGVSGALGCGGWGVSWVGTC